MAMPSGAIVMGLEGVQLSSLRWIWAVCIKVRLTALL